MLLIFLTRSDEATTTRGAGKTVCQPVLSLLEAGLDLGQSVNQCDAQDALQPTFDCEHAMTIELYRDPNHVCLMFTDLMSEDGEAVQCNQFLIIDHGEGAILDPGGNQGFNELLMTITKHIPLSKMKYLLASHADPDIIGALDRWMTSTSAKLVISRIWERFAPHFTKQGKTTGRVIGVPDAGGKLFLGKTELWLLPAHFMHAEGNFHFYDPVSRILFTGDLGVSLMNGGQAQKPVRDLAPHIPAMAGFHRRYMASNKILRLWVKMARKLDIAMIVPQHGASIVGSKAVKDFLDWIENLPCGVDLFDESNYQVATTPLDAVAA